MHLQYLSRASLVAQVVKYLPAMQETWVRSLGWQDPLEKGKATHSSILAWRIPWTKSMGSQRVRHVNFQMFKLHLEKADQAAFRKSRGTTDQIANIHWIIEKQESSRMTYTSALFTMPKPVTVSITSNCGTLFKGWEYQTT